jgi:hypothetical protein
MRAFLFAVALFGCGTDTFKSTDGAAPSDAASEASSDASGDATDPCPAMRLQIEMSKKQLLQCNPTSGGACMGTVSDGCCQFATSVDNTTSFQALVSQWKNQCNPICTGACPQVMHVCVPDGMGGGTCH